MNRIAIIGGDKRSARFPWPTGYDLRFYASVHDGGVRELRKLVASCHSGTVRFAIILSKWNSHSVQGKLRNEHIPFTLWAKGLNELASELPNIAARYSIYPENTEEKKEQIVTKAKETLVVDNAKAGTVAPTPAPKKPNFFVETWSEEEKTALQLAVEKSGSIVDMYREFSKIVPKTIRSKIAFQEKILRMFKKDILNRSGKGTRTNPFIYSQGTAPTQKSEDQNDLVKANPDSVNEKASIPLSQQCLLFLETCAEPITSFDLAKRMKIKHRTMNFTLNNLFKRKLVIHVGGNGGKGDPFKFALTHPPVKPALSIVEPEPVAVPATVIPVTKPKPVVPVPVMPPQTMTASTDDVEVLRVRLSGGRIARVLFQGLEPTRAEIAKLIQYLELSKNDYPM